MESGNSGVHPRPDMIALSIQQPWAELILQGVKTIEVRRTPARPQGPIYLYTSRRLSKFPGWDAVLSDSGITPEALPLGVIVGTVNILDCRRARPEDAAAARVNSALLADAYSWILGNARRFSQPLQPRYVPYGTWFYPFHRKRTKTRQRRNHGGA